MYRPLIVTNNVDLFNVDWLNYCKNTKKVTTILQFHNGDKWVSLIKDTDEFLAPKGLQACNFIKRKTPAQLDLVGFKE